MPKAKKNASLFLSGVIVLTLSNVLIKLIGLTLKIPLQNILGGEGMGYYNTAYEIYVWLYMVSTAGLPVAVSILISESRARGNIAEAKKIFRIVTVLFLIIGAVGSSVMIFGSRMFADMYELPSAAYCIIAVAPTLFFICVSSAIRGFFQGYQNMFPTAISQVIEAVGKLVLGISFARLAIAGNMGVPMAAAYAIAGVTVGVLAGMIFLCFAKGFFRSEGYDMQYVLPEGSPIPEIRTTKTLLIRLISLAVPITLSSSIMSLTSMLDSAQISNILESTYHMIEAERATVLGNYKTLAVTLFNVPPALIYPISYSIIPLLTAAITKDGQQRAKSIMQSAYKVAALIALPCSVGLSVMAKPILSVLFSDKEAIDFAAPLLSVLSLTVFFIGMLAISNAVLQANHRERLPIISMVVGSGVKLLSSWLLISNPTIWMYGAPIGTFLCYFVIVLINFFFVAKYVGYIPPIRKILLRPLLASLLCGGAAGGVYRLSSAVFGITAETSGRSMQAISACVLGMLAAAIVYFAAVFLLRAIEEEDILLLPKGNKIASVLKKIKLLRS